MSVAGLDADDVAARPPPGPQGGGDEASLVGLARETSRYARAWGHLVAGEAALAKINLGRLLLAMLFVPALAIGIVVGIDGVLAGLLHYVVADWMLALAGVVVVNLVFLIGLYFVLRRWWRTLSLPRSREALSRLWKNPFVEKRDDSGTACKDPARQGGD